ncbi:MAG: apolipoprotein N-acyltransferase [bacterium]
MRLRDASLATSTKCVLNAIYDRWTQALNRLKDGPKSTMADKDNSSMEIIYCFGLLTVGAIALAVSFPSPGLWWSAWIALVPLMIVARRYPKKLLASGWYFGALANTICFSWVTHSMTVYGGLSKWLSAFALLIMAMILGAFTAAAVCTANSIVRYSSAKSLRIFIWPLCWVAFDFLRAHLPLGLAFPWNCLGHSQYSVPYILQNADWASFYGISFLVVLINAAITEVLMDYSKSKMPVLIAALILCLALVYGAVRYHMDYSDSTFKVGIVQANVSLTEKWQPETRYQTLMDHIQLSERILGEAQLLVWSESSLPFIFRYAWRYDDGHANTLGYRLEQFLLQSNTTLLTGTLDRVDDEIFNAAVLAGPQKPDAYFYKQRLVPFGEFVPMKKLFFFVNRMVSDQIGEFSAGTSVEPLALDNHHALAITICYENIFPELVRERVRAGADMICNVTNDAWFGKTSAPEQHLSAACFRAVETRRPVIRCANSGYSAAIDPKGRIQIRSSLFTKESFIVEINPGEKRTVYLLFGDWFAYGCLFIMLMLYLSCMNKRYRLLRKIFGG